MKRIALLVCAMVLLVANTAEARRSRNSGRSYTQPTRVAPATYTTTTYTSRPAQPAPVVTAAYSRPTTQPATVAATVAAASYSTSTAQGVANIMASRGQVGHWGGNPGYEGCGMGASPQAAYSICCYANSGMATVDVGYARGANGMWYCCRRYR